MNRNAALRILAISTAEDLHVCGQYAKSLAVLRQIWTNRSPCFELAKKIAVSYLTLKRYRLGGLWLDRALILGLCEDEYCYIQTQGAIARGEIAFSLKLLREKNAGKAPKTNLLNLESMIWASVGNSERARQLLELAREIEPSDPYVLMNIAVLHKDGCKDYQYAMLAAAARIAPHLGEIHRSYQSCFSSLPDDRLLVAKTREELRDCHTYGPLQGEQKLGKITIAAKIAISSESISGSVCIRLDTEKVSSYPVAVMVNAGCNELVNRIDGTDVVLYPAADRNGLETVGSTNIFDLPAEAWETKGGKTRTTLHFSFNPRGRGATITPSFFEFSAKSGWIPIPLGAFDTCWKTKISSALNFNCLFSRSPDEPIGIDGIAAGLQVVATILITGPLGVEILVFGNIDSAQIRLLEVVVKMTWRVLTAYMNRRCVRRFSIVVAPYKNSTFCYARNGYIRLAEGILTSERILQVSHEMAHLWWGVETRVAPGCEWVSEGLAEFSLHLMQSAGNVSGYREAILADLGDEIHSSISLKNLATNRDHKAQQVFREKAGYLFWMLRQVIGEDIFLKLLHVLSIGGQGGRSLTSDDVIAVAGYLYGRTLRWFFRQWVENDGRLRFAVNLKSMENSGGEVVAVISLICYGEFTPGTDVSVVILTKSGTRHIFQVSVELGRATMSITLDSSPREIIVDPDLNFYALREDYCDIEIPA